MKTLTYLKRLPRSAKRTIKRLLRHLLGKSIVSATLTLSIPPFIKLELGFRQESEQHGAAWQPMAAGFGRRPSSQGPWSAGRGVRNVAGLF